VAGARQSQASHRRNRDSQDSTTQQRVTLIVLGVLVAVGIIVAAGVVWGVVLPPRAHVITVGNTSFNAQAVEEVAEFLVLGGSQSNEDPVIASVDQIKRSETLLQAGASEAGDISADDIAKAIRVLLGAPDNMSAADYAKAYDSFLKGSSLDKPTFERMVRAQVIGDRLAKKFAAGVGDAGLQLHVQGVTSRDQNKLKQFRDTVMGGADFVATAVSTGLATSAAAADFGWDVPPTSGVLKDKVHIVDLKAGTTTDVIPREGTFQYDVFRLAERDEHRTYTDDQKKTLGQVKVDEWIAQQADKVKVSEDISDGERTWITRQVAKSAQRIAQQRASSTPPPFSVTVVPGGAK